MSWPPHDLIVKAPVFVVHVLIYWHYYGRKRHNRRVQPWPTSFLHNRARINRPRANGDHELRTLAARAVLLVGGWKNARILLRGFVADPGITTFRPARGIRIRDD